MFIASILALLLVIGLLFAYVNTHDAPTIANVDDENTAQNVTGR